MCILESPRQRERYPGTENSVVEIGEFNFVTQNPKKYLHVAHNGRLTAL